MVVGHLRADRQPRVLLYITPILAGSVVLVTLVVLAQWLSGFFQSVSSSLKWVPMAPLTAILFLLIGIALLLRSQLPDRRLLSSLVRTVSIFVLLVSLYLVLHNFINALSTDIEGFLTAPATSASGSIIGRMSPVTAILFIFISISLFISTLKRERPDQLLFVADVLTLSVFVTALVIALGYWYKAPLFYGGTTIPVAILTAISFLFISTAQLFNKPENLFHRFATSRSVTAQICRPIMPISILILLAGTYVEEISRSIIDPNIFSVAHVGLTLAVIAAIVLVISVVSRRVDRDIVRKEIALINSETRYHRLFEAAKDGVLIVNAETGLIVDANPSLIDLLGLSKEEFLGKELWEIGAFKDIVANKANFEELRQKSHIRYEGLPLKASGGREINVEFNSNVYEVDHHKVIQCNIRDITERKRAEERISHLATVLRAIRNVNQLITHEKDNQSLIQKSCNLLAQRKGYEMAWILLLDDNGKFAGAASTALGEKAPAFMKQLETGNYPECVREVLSQEQSFLAYGRPGKQHKGCVLAGEHSQWGIFGYKLEYEGKLYGVLGASVPLATVFDKEEEDLFLELGSDVAFALASIESENKRKQTEDALGASEENFRHSVDNSPLGIRILNTDGETIYANQALLDIYGFASLEELKMTPNKKVYTPESYTEHRERVEKRQRGEYVPASYEIGIVRKDGNIRHLEVIRKDVNWSGKPQFQMLYRDITQVKRLQQQLIMQDRLASIGQLVSGVAHELNNPLTSVIGFSELLLQRELPDDIKADLKIVNDEAKRTSLIVKNLLTFARQQPQDKRAVDINEPIKTVLQLRDHEQSINNIVVSTHFAPDLPQIVGNSSQLQQVFFNIVTNAEQAMLETHNKGTLTVTTKQIGNLVRASFADDGPGISRENMTRLFSPFFTTKEPGKGTGLGLSICQGIVNEHNGKIWAESEQGKGATFIVELPICKS